MAAKKSAAAEQGVYRVIDVIGTSPVSWEEAAKSAVETAGGSLRDLRIAEVTRLDVKIEAGRVVAFRARLQLPSSTRPSALDLGSGVSVLPASRLGSLHRGSRKGPGCSARDASRRRFANDRLRGAQEYGLATIDVRHPRAGISCGCARRPLT